MDNYVYSSINKYFNILRLTGYYPQKNVERLLVLLFYWHLLYEDYRGYVSAGDYEEIEKAMNCLYGTNCLIPYPDYLKMGKLHLGEMTEMAQRVKTLEETKVAKVENLVGDIGGDVVIMEEE